VSAKKANAAPIVIDLLEDDDALPTPLVSDSNGDRMMEDVSAEEEEKKPVPVARPAKRTAKKGGRAKKTSPPPDSEPSSLPVGSESAMDFGETMSLRRAATIPISQIHSKTNTAISPSSLPETPAPVEPMNNGFKPRKTLSSIVSPSLPTKLSTKNLGKEAEVELERQPTAVLPNDFESPTPRSSMSLGSSLPSKLPSSQFQSSSIGQNQMKSSASSIFRFQGSIDVNLVKAVDVDELETMEPAFGGLKRRSSIMSSKEMSMHLSDDEEDANALLYGATQKKHCGPGHSSTSKIQTPKTKAKTEEASSASPPGTSKSSAKAESEDTGYKRTSGYGVPAPKPVPSNPDDLLDEILGGTSKSQYTVIPSTPAPTYSLYARHDVSAARAAIQRVRATASHTHTIPTTIYGSNSSSSSRYNTITLKLQIGPQVLSISARGSDSGDLLLAQLRKAEKLPALLPNEQFFIKFDNAPMDSARSLAENLVGNGDTLVLSVKRDGREIHDPFAELDQQPDGGEEDAPQNTNKIRLKARYPGENEGVMYRLSKDEPLSKLVDAAAKKLGVPASKIKIVFDGDALNPNQCVDDMEEPLEDGDMVEIRLAK
jgi:hypothetical protein